MCPITPLEMPSACGRVKRAYTGDFVTRYVLPALYPANLTREIQLVIGSAALLVNVVMYGYVLHRRAP